MLFGHGNRSLWTQQQLINEVQCLQDLVKHQVDLTVDERKHLMQTVDDEESKQRQVRFREFAMLLFAAHSETVWPPGKSGSLPLKSTEAARRAEGTFWRAPLPTVHDTFADISIHYVFQKYVRLGAANINWSYAKKSMARLPTENLAPWQPGSAEAAAVAAAAVEGCSSSDDDSDEDMFTDATTTSAVARAAVAASAANAADRVGESQVAFGDGSFFSFRHESIQRLALVARTLNVPLQAVVEQAAESATSIQVDVGATQATRIEALGTKMSSFRTSTSSKKISLKTMVRVLATTAAQAPAFSFLICFSRTHGHGHETSLITGEPPAEILGS